MSETPIEETAPAEQEPTEETSQGNPGEDALGDAGKQALDRMKAERNEAAKRAKALEKELEAFREASKTEQEKALDAARKEGHAEALKASAPRLVAAEFKAAAAGRMTAEQVKELTEDLDLSKYLTEDGEVDTDRIVKKIDALAPAPVAEERRTAPSFGGGPRKTEPARAGSLGEAIQNKLAGSTR